jgi:hypothetical protein
MLLASSFRIVSDASEDKLRLSATAPSPADVVGTHIKDMQRRECRQAGAEGYGPTNPMAVAVDSKCQQQRMCPKSRHKR